MEEELKKEFGSNIEVELIPGSGGVYSICRNGKQIFSKKEVSRFPDDGEVLRLLREQA